MEIYSLLSIDDSPHCMGLHHEVILPSQLDANFVEMSCLLNRSRAAPHLQWLQHAIAYQNRYQRHQGMPSEILSTLCLPWMTVCCISNDAEQK